MIILHLIWVPIRKTVSHRPGPEDIGPVLLPGKLNPWGLIIHSATGRFYEEYLLLSHCNWTILRVSCKDFLLSEKLTLWLKVQTVAMYLCCSPVVKQPIKTSRIFPKYSCLPTQLIMSNFFKVSFIDKDQIGHDLYTPILRRTYFQAMLYLEPTQNSSREKDNDSK